MLSVVLRYTDSDYPFGDSKLFLFILTVGQLATAFVIGFRRVLLPCIHILYVIYCRIVFGHYYIFVYETDRSFKLLFCWVLS